jgi:charged multivesicular body protein 5
MQYDMEELLEQANEVQESLSQSYAVPDEIDEADLEAGAYLFPWRGYSFSPQGLNAELDALGMEEEEGESYLADLNKAPDFIDEAPIEAPEVRHLWFL